MNEIVEELDLGCAPLRALSSLEHCFRAGAEGASKPLFVSLVKAYFNVTIDKPATLDFESAPAPKRAVFASSRIRWVPEAGGLLPAFHGSLNIHRTEAHDGRCSAVIRGAFTATPGKNGKMLDPAFSLQIVRETARGMLEMLRTICESVE